MHAVYFEYTVFETNSVIHSRKGKNIRNFSNIIFLVKIFIPQFRARIFREFIYAPQRKTQCVQLKYSLDGRIFINVALMLQKFRKTTRLTSHKL